MSEYLRHMCDQEKIWVLESEYQKLESENKKMKSILQDFISTKECKRTWIEEMHSTIEDVLSKMDK